MKKSGRTEKRTSSKLTHKRNWYEKEFTGTIKLVNYKTKTNARWKQKSVILEKIEEQNIKLKIQERKKKTVTRVMNRVVDIISKQYRGLFDYNILKMKGISTLFQLNETRKKEFLLGWENCFVY
jgi:hypothetical protein